MKKLLLALLTILAIPTFIFASPTSVNRLTDHIEPLIRTDYIKAPYFVASSTTKSTFPYASTTAISATTICLSTDCKTAWPTGGGGTPCTALEGSIQYNTGGAFDCDTLLWYSHENNQLHSPTHIIENGNLFFDTQQNDSDKEITVLTTNNSDAVNGSSLHLYAESALFGSTDANGGNITLNAGESTGLGTSEIQFWTANPDSFSSTNSYAPTLKATINGVGDLVMNGGNIRSTPGSGQNLYLYSDNYIGSVNHQNLAFYFSTDYYDGQVLMQFGNTATNNVGYFGLRGNGRTFFQSADGAEIGDGNGTGYLPLRAGNTTANGVLTSTGNTIVNGHIGVGSTSPFARLSVKGDGTTTGINFQTTNSNNVPLFTIYDNGTTTFGRNVSTGTTAPLNVSFGGTYGTNTAGSILNQKWTMYNDGVTPANNYGIGMSANLMEYQVPSGASHGFYVAGTQIAKVDATGITTGSAISATGNIQTTGGSFNTGSSNTVLGSGFLQTKIDFYFAPAFPQGTPPTSMIFDIASNSTQLVKSASVYKWNTLNINKNMSGASTYTESGYNLALERNVSAFVATSTAGGFLKWGDRNKVLGAIDRTGAMIIGSTTPTARLGVQGFYGSTTPMFDIASTTNAQFATSSIFRVNADGNVGIGTSSPANKLTVSGDVGFYGTAPTLSSCGTSPAITKGSTDSAMEFTQGGVSTGCQVTFAVAKTNAPFCTVTSQAGLAFSYTISTSAITITNIGALSSSKFDIMCIQNNN